MPTRLAACDPCRISKLACDHRRPVCSRCRDADRATECNYRSRPFKKRKVGSLVSSTSFDGSGIESASSHEAAALPRVASQINHYPNPGYLGNSSHATIFNHLSPTQRHQIELSSANPGSGQQDGQPDEAHVSQGALAIQQMLKSLRTGTTRRLIDAWVSKGVNLALAGAFTQLCAQSAEHVFDRCVATEAMAVSRDLFTSSLRPLPIAAGMTIGELAASFCDTNARWETLGLFFAAASRATVDVPIFEPLYSTEQQRRAFQHIAMQYSDRCLEIALSLDCLNDLQLLLQYENFISHSFGHGDQSYQTWRKLGDVASSLFALGYHEQVGSSASIPSFLRSLRMAAFARAYSADKNMSIFLGRPPRINRKYCKIDISSLDIHTSGGSSASLFAEDPLISSKKSFNYMTDTVWSFRCALLKERILELSKDEGSDERSQSLRDIEDDVEGLWSLLPHELRLEGPLRLSNRDPVERDFVVSARLNYLHVLHLLRLALARRTPEIDSRLLLVSADMLSLTVEALVLKEHLVNSGTGLVWKVAYYGLPAAGIICLSLLKQATSIENWGVDTSKIFRDLSVLVAEVETGSLVRMEEPNYALLAGATGAIKSILDRVVFNGKNTTDSQMLMPNVEVTAREEDDWFPWVNIDTWDFEREFWMNLAEHPILTGGELDTREFPP